MSKRPSHAEVWNAVKSMDALKAPGLDGFQPIFYQKCWGIVGESVVTEVLKFFETRKVPKDLNKTLICLIAKVGKPERIQQFRPIALCNVLYKIMSKVLVHRLQGMIGDLVSWLKVVLYLED